MTGMGGAGALRFLLDLGGPVNVLMSGDVGLSPGVTHPDSSELMLLSPALYKIDIDFGSSVYLFLHSYLCSNT